MKEVKAWLEQLTWTPAHAGAFAELATMNTPQPWMEDGFAEPARVHVWLEAALVDNALACCGKRARQLTPSIAHKLAYQLTGGAFRWARYKSRHEALHERDRMRYQGALLLALVGDWDKVAATLGSTPLARRVAVKKTYDGKAFGGLVRHCATAAKNKLGEGSCQAALKAWAARKDTNPGVLLALASLAIEGAGGHPRAEVARRLEALLTGDAAAPVKSAPALVEDAQASVFERYLPVLNDPDAIKQITFDDYGEFTTTSRMVQAWCFGFDDLVTKKLEHPERHNLTLPNAWPIAAASFGRPVKGWRALLLADLKRFHSPREANRLAAYRWSTGVAALALAAGDTKLVTALTVGPKKEAFKPGKTFGDDARKTLRYFARAMEAKAKQADVTPAWLELLVARVPRDHEPTLPGGAWSWASLLCLSYAYFHLIGGAPEGQVAKRLRAALRGVREP